MSDSESSDDDVEGREDPEASESASASLSMFNEDLSTLLLNGLQDRTAFKTMIAEVEHVRNAYQQDATVLNKSVIRVLFELPLLSGFKGDTFELYLRRMDDLFDQYSPLLKSLKRDQKTQNQGAEAIS